MSAFVAQGGQVTGGRQPEYESALFVIAKKDSDYFAFVDKSYSKIKMLLEKLSLATTVAEYVKV